VWVGYDDNSRTRLSGARAALPIWIRFMARVAPPGGYGTFPQPPGISTAVIDPETGLLASEYCPVVLTEVFRQGEVPTELCPRHQSWTDAQFAGIIGGEEYEDGTARIGEEARSEADAEKRHPFQRWLKKVFGSGDNGGGKQDADRDDEDEDPPPP
jgi:membrane carboxypeptidase/penicillin-binding protein